MISSQLLKSYSKVVTLSRIRMCTKTPKCGNLCPEPTSSPEIINKKSIESRYEECEQLLRIKRFQKGYQSVARVLKGDITMADVKVFATETRMKTVESWKKFLASKELHIAKECAICSFILSYKGFQVAHQQLPVLVQAFFKSDRYKRLKRQGVAVVQESYSYAKGLVDNRSLKK